MKAKAGKVKRQNLCAKVLRDEARERARQWHYAGPLRTWPAGCWRLEQAIEIFWDRYDEDGVKRTIKIDECDRRRVSRELAEHLKGTK